jgi:hypothetical protein
VVSGLPLINFRFLRPEWMDANFATGPESRRKDKAIARACCINVQYAFINTDQGLLGNKVLRRIFGCKERKYFYPGPVSSQTSTIYKFYY